MMRIRSVGVSGRISTISYRSVRFHSSHNPKATSLSADEMAHFNALASSWWDVNGPQRILHKMNLLRMDFIHSTIRNHIKLNGPEVPVDEQIYIPPFNVDLLPKPIRNTIIKEQDDKRDSILNQVKWKVLDIGCGGGILSESLARLSFIDNVKGIDLSKDVLEAAKLHKLKDPLLNDNKLNYELMAIEDVPASEKYDIVTMFEMLEHVDHPSKVLVEALKRVERGGWVFISTINRDFISWFTTIFMGEHILKIVPVGTHTLEKYINQSEIRQWFDERKDSFKVVDAKGCIYLPAYGWKFTSSPDVGNYFMAIQRIK
ncbi:S-adenosyl-L-methionine-dependent methyltransferase [Scheffersomyces amazonensis]|uniref:S-adenosyl-L-methionine-dependent methyltransferase n=1 Tax=Scheffersomyces amazonensis TaxID=1078765 RepID=UPI00315D2C99